MDNTEYKRNKELLKNDILELIKERKNKLFVTRFKVPGRRFKFIIAFTTMLHVYGQVKFNEIQDYFKYKNVENMDIQRKVLPFMQMFVDLDYITLEKRRQVIIESLFDGKKLELIKKLDNGFINPLPIWTPYRARENVMHQGICKDYRPATLAVETRMDRGYDVFNI